MAISMMACIFRYVVHCTCLAEYEKERNTQIDVDPQKRRRFWVNQGAQEVFEATFAPLVALLPIPGKFV